MKLKQLGANMTELELQNGNRILFSYEIPVAAKRIVDGFNVPQNNDFSRNDLYWQYIKTNQFYSQTTNKHINKWLSLYNMPCVNEQVNQSVLDELIK